MAFLIQYVFPIVIMLGLFYLIVFLPENKRRKKYNEMLNALKVNEEVLTRGGIIGKITSIQGDFVIIQSGPDRARLKVSKNGIAEVLKSSVENK